MNREWTHKIIDPMEIVMICNILKKRENRSKLIEGQICHFAHKPIIRMGPNGILAEVVQKREYEERES